MLYLLSISFYAISFNVFFLTWFLLKSVSIEFIQGIIYDPEIIRKIKQIMI